MCVCLVLTTYFISHIDRGLWLPYQSLWDSVYKYSSVKATTWKKRERKKAFRKLANKNHDERAKRWDTNDMRIHKCLLLCITRRRGKKAYCIRSYVWQYRISISRLSCDQIALAGIYLTSIYWFFRRLACPLISPLFLSRLCVCIRSHSFCSCW